MPMMSPSLPDLSDCAVWLTRPIGQTPAWQAIFEEAGAHVLVEPLLKIVPPDDADTTAAQLDRAEDADIIIAASANAVAGAARLRPYWSPTGTLIAVGPASAEALAQQAGRTVITPGTANSEGLLAVPELCEVSGSRVTVLAGHDGRRLLVDTLAVRGARVEKVALYRRQPTSIDEKRLDRLLDADIIVVTSMDAWLNLNSAVGGARRERLARCRLVAASRSVVKQASHDVDWRVAPIVIENMGTRGAVAALGRARAASEQ